MKPGLICVDNIRYGFACNSSSTHSLIFINPKRKVQDDFIPVINDKDELTGGEFGWDFFTIASKEGKKLYLALLAEEYYDQFPKELRDEIFHPSIKKYGNGVWDPGRNENEGFIDHQSIISFPTLAKDSTKINLEFFKDYKDFIFQNNLVIIGGNDNSNDDHSLVGKPGNSKPFETEFPISADSSICRKDPVYNYWTLFNKINGDRVRFRFTNNLEDVTKVPDKAYSPELVDIKITDYCERNCSYCYQDSNPNGKHGDIKIIKRLIKSLSDLQVFEIAIGGGEPTQHPHFLEILKECRNNNIIPNFTTKSLTWMNTMDVDYINELIGSFAYTVSSMADILEFSDAIKKYKMSKRNDDDIPEYGHTVQIVLGTLPQDEYNKIIEYVYDNGFKLVLLAYKMLGRGKKYNIIDYDWWFEELVKKSNEDYYGTKIKVGVDTKLCDDFTIQLLKHGIPKYYFETDEGKFSCAIDAVEGTIAPTSYCDKEKIQKFNFGVNNKILTKNILNEFQKF